MSLNLPGGSWQAFPSSWLHTCLADNCCLIILYIVISKALAAEAFILLGLSLQTCTNRKTQFEQFSKMAMDPLTLLLAEDEDEVIVFPHLES